jgi:hypothetical protein
MPQGNPYAQFGRSQRLSQFVDESIPAELMLRGITATQKRQDKMQDLLDKASMWNPDTLEGGDTELKERTKAGIKDFSDEWAMKNMSTAKNQLTVKNYLKGIALDDRIKQAEKNYKKKVEMEAMITKMKAAGASPFDPSIQKAQRTLQAYEKSMLEGESFDKIDVEKALNIEAKERSYYAGMKDNGNQWFDNSIKNLPEGFFGKKGWTGVTDKRVIDRAKEVAQDYMNTPEGMQAAAIYRERVLDFKSGLPNGIDPSKETVVDYLGKRILKAGKPLVGGRSTISAQRLPVEKTGNTGGDTPPGPDDFVVDTGIPIPETIKEVPELKKIIANKKGEYSPTQIKEAQSDLDKIQIALDNDPEYQAYFKDLTQLVTGNSDDPEKNIIYPTEQATNNRVKKTLENFEGVIVTDGYGTTAEGSMFTDEELKAGKKVEKDKEIATFLEPLSKYVGEELPKLIKEEILTNNNSELASALAKGSLLGLYQTGGGSEKIQYGIEIAGTDIKKTFAELGAGTELTDDFQMEKNGVWSEYGGPKSISKNTYAKWAVKKALESMSNSLTTDFTWDLDGSDRVVNRLESIRDKQKEKEGTSITTSYTSMPIDDATRADMDLLLKDLEKGNYELVSYRDNKLMESADEIDDNEEFKNQLLSNPSNPNITVRPSLGSRALEITSKIPHRVAGKPGGTTTFLLREKRDASGNVIQQQGFEALYKMGTGDTQSADYVGANDVIRNQTTSTPQNLRRLLASGNVANVYPSNYNPNVTVKLNQGADAKQSPYVVGDNDGLYTQKDVYDVYDSLVETYKNNLGTTSTSGMEFTAEGLEALQSNIKPKQELFFVRQAINAKVVPNTQDGVADARSLFSYLDDIKADPSLESDALNLKYKNIQNYLNKTNLKARNLDDIMDYVKILSMVKTI